MKKIVSMIVLFMASVILFAQQDVTQFLGIPVDGTKSAMIEKLKTKGFQYNSTFDQLEGEFNGEQVYLSIVTDNNKVWRIMVQDAVPMSESQIKIRYNKLCSQFLNNKKYTPLLSSENYYLSENEDISYEISVHDKQYQAGFFQNPIDNSNIADAIDKYLEHLYKKLVWFTIHENVRFGRGYIILMYYDNEYNHSNGEDL